MASAELIRAVDGYDKYIQQHNGIADIQAINAYIDATRFTMEKENDIQYGLKLLAKAKAYTNDLIRYSTKGGDFYALDSYCNQHDTTFDVLNAYYDLLLLEAPYKFESYLLYLERRRIESERFYSPKAIQLNRHGLIQAMQDLEDDKLDRVCISMPPSTQKTTLEKFFCSWIIGKYVDGYSIFFSHSADITDMFYRGILNITTDNTEYNFSEIFPNVTLEATNAKVGTINFGKYKPYANIQVSSIGAKNSGKIRANKYIYCDDLIGGIEEALNEAQLEKIWRIYSVDLKQRKLNEKVKELIIMTRWSVRDPVGRIIDVYGNDPRLKVIAVPDIDEKTGKSNFDYKYNGMSVKHFEDMALTMDDVSYRCLYKNEPIERKGRLYTEEELRRYTEVGKEKDNARVIVKPDREPDAILGVCDVKNKGVDLMFMPCFEQYDDDYFLVECVCDETADFGVQEAKCTDLILDHNMQQCEFESNAGGDRFASDVAKRVEENGGRCNITTKATETNKETRIIVNADWIKKHIIFRQNSDYAPKSDYGVMMGWLMRYTTEGKNLKDDVPDGLANFCLYVTKGRNVRKATISRSWI